MGLSSQDTGHRYVVPMLAAALVTWVVEYEMLKEFLAPPNFRVPLGYRSKV